MSFPQSPNTPQTPLFPSPIPPTPGGGGRSPQPSLGPAPTPYTTYFGAGVRLLTLPKVLQNFNLRSLTLPELRTLCHLIRVPIITLANTEFINALQFQIGMQALTRIGQPSLDLTPLASLPPDSLEAHRIHPSYTSDNLYQLLSEMLVSQRLAYVAPAYTLPDELSALASKTLSHVLSNLTEQQLTDFDASSIQDSIRNGELVLPPPSSEPVP